MLVGGLCYCQTDMRVVEGVSNQADRYCYQSFHLTLGKKVNKITGKMGQKYVLKRLSNMLKQLGSFYQM